MASALQRLIVLPSPGLGYIAQEEAEELIHLENEVQDAQRRRDAFAASLLERLRKGHACEPGPYSLKLVTRSRGGQCLTRLLVC